MRYAIRTLLRNPGFTAAAVLTLALGIGANTAIFSAVDAALLRPLPFRDPNALVQLWETHPLFGHAPIAYPDYMDWRAQSSAFEQIGAYTFQGFQKFQLTATGEPEEIAGSLVSENLLPALGLEPELGRNLLPGETQVVLISDALWRRQFGADPGILERDIRMNGAGFRVIGVLPPRSFPAWAEVLAPLSLLSDYDRTSRKHHLLESVGRLKAGVPAERALAGIQTIAARLALDYPATNSTIGAAMVPLARQLAGDARTPLLVLLAVVGLVLLIATANVANLLLARAAGRRKEIAIRIALGAGRGHLLRQMLTESLVLAAAGGFLGVLIAAAGTPWLRMLAEGRIPRADQIVIDLRVLCFAFGIAIIAGLLFGLAPALAAGRIDQNSLLKEGGRSAGGSLHRGLRAALVAGQVALAMLVLVSAGLLTRSLARLIDVDPGFRTDRLLTFRLTLPPSRYTTAERAQGFFAELMARSAALPGAEGAATIDALPLTAGFNRTRFGVDGVPLPEPGRFPVAQVRSVSPNYFDFMRIPLVAGRGFTDHDINDVPVIVNQALARQYFPGQNAVGRRLLLGVVDTKPASYPIVGVVADTLDLGLSTPSEPEMYFAGFNGAASLVIRTTKDPMSLAGALRRQVAALDPELPITAMQTMDEIVDRSLAGRRFSVLLIGLFGALALTLAAVGLYGVVSYSVAQRTREMGLRLALGARPWQVTRMVLGEAMQLTLAGVALGAIAARAAGQALQSQLYGVTPADLQSFALAAGALLAVALAGSYLPARRAMKVDPIEALRDE